MAVSTSKWTTCRLCPKAPWMNYLQAIISVCCFSHCERFFFINSLQRSKMYMVLVGVQDIGGKYSTASSFHPNPQCVVVNCVHIFQKECFLEWDWRGLRGAKIIWAHWFIPEEHLLYRYSKWYIRIERLRVLKVKIQILNLITNKMRHKQLWLGRGCFSPIDMKSKYER